MNKRIKKLKDMMLDGKHLQFRVEKFEGSIIDEKTEDLPLPTRKSLAFKYAAENMPVFMLEGELILGSRTIFNLPRYHTDREMEESRLSSNNIKDPIFNNVYNESVDEIGDKVADTNPPNYHKLIKKGLGWYKGFAEEKLSRGGLTDEEKAFYEASVISIEGVQAYIKRFADLIRKQLQESGISADRKAELETMEKNMIHMADKAPISLFQAVQLVNFIHTLLWTEGITLVSFERMDQAFYPVYKAELEAGKTGPDQAREILECLLIKVNEGVDRPNNRFEWLKGDTGQTITLGGTLYGNKDESGENDITFLMLEAIKELGLIDPHLHVRVGENTSDRLWDGIIDMVSLGRGIPIIDADVNIQEALRNVGLYSEQDIADYSGTGCWEIIIAGKTSYRQCGNIDLLRPLEWLLYGGINPRDENTRKNPAIDNRYTGIRFEKLDFPTFEEFLDAYKSELRYYLMMVANNVIKTRLSYNPLNSTLVDDCLENGKDIKDGGARYKETDFQASSLANAVDSLFSIKKLVFEERSLSLEEFREILEHDWDNKEDLRQKVRNKYPKYGNDLEEVDTLARDITDFFAAEVTRYTNGWGGPFRARIAGASSYVDNIDILGASPDGRKEGDYTSLNSSPQIGFDKNGPTGIIKSVTAIDSSRFAGGFILDLKFSKDVFATPENRDKVRDLFKTYIKLGGMQLQVNVVDSDVLRDAQKNPEKHKDLIVRVWGFSAYFVDLPAEFQEHVIKRTELGL
jgi:pyruvate-formate lyase